MSAATTTRLSPMNSKARTPRTARDKGAPSPNYFNPVLSPQSTPADPHTNLEAFRRQSETNTFSLGHSNLSYFSTNSGSRNTPAETSSTGSRVQEDNVLSPLSQPRIVPPMEKDTETADPMDVDKPSPQQAPQLRPSDPLNTKSPSIDPPSFFDVPRQQSPFTASPVEKPARRQLSHIDERHPRNSLPHNRIDPPSPAPREPVKRAETLPNSLSTDAPNLISPQELSDIFELYPPEQILLLDVRVFPQYSQSRIDGALNLCIPTTLLKRPAFTVQKLADTFTREKEKAKFGQWKDAKVIVVYDIGSCLLKDATSAVNTLKKFTNEGWHGSPCIVRGGYLGFSKKFPSSIDRRLASEMESSQGRRLSIDPSKPLGAAVAGGCMMPAEKKSANAFFGTIRQNMDLIGGVGQIPIQVPSRLKEDNSRFLPPWLKRATSPRDQGKVAADYFLKIEKGEQQRMQKALTGTVHYGSPTTTSPDAVKIAGIEKGTKNRYKDMLPYDHSRVRLQNVPAGECDYINASHIKSALSGRRYIASQAPVPATIEDFWRVVWEQNVHVIVMLTAEHDGGQRKSHPYWDGNYGKYSVKVDSTRLQSLEASRSNTHESEPNVLIRQITVSGPGGSRCISQLHYSGWPDFGVPTDPKHLLNLVRVSRGEVQKYESASPKRHEEMPVLVHCSAGCGRTGTFCTVDSVVATLEAGLVDWKTEIFPADNESRDDLVAKTVEDFRLQRLSMVQTLRQFVLCYETVLKWYSEWLSERLSEHIEEVREHHIHIDDAEGVNTAAAASSRVQNIGTPPSQGRNWEEVKAWWVNRKTRSPPGGPLGDKQIRWLQDWAAAAGKRKSQGL